MHFIFAPDYLNDSPCSCHLLCSRRHSQRCDEIAVLLQRASKIGSTATEKAAAGARAFLGRYPRITLLVASEIGVRRFVVQQHSALAGRVVGANQRTLPRAISPSARRVVARVSEWNKVLMLPNSVYIYIHAMI